MGRIPKKTGEVGAEPGVAWRELLRGGSGEALVYCLHGVLPGAWAELTVQGEPSEGGPPGPDGSEFLFWPSPPSSADTCRDTTPSTTAVPATGI